MKTFVRHANVWAIFQIHILFDQIFRPSILNSLQHSRIFSDSLRPRKNSKGSDIHPMPSEILSTLRRIMGIFRVNKHSQYTSQ
jgi:hypothetical protein